MPRKLKGNGLCGCGCGGRTRRYRQRHIPDGIERGDYALFLKGHARRSSGVDYVEQDRGYKTPCWVWQRARFKSGYAQIGQGKRAHVVYWERRFGPVPPGKQLDHLCRVVECVNPDHLEPVTPAINVRRSRTAKLTQEQVDVIRSRASELQADLAREFGISQSQVSRIIRKKRWS